MRLSILFFTTLLSAQPPAYQLNSQVPRSAKQGAITPIAHLRAADGGRFIVSKTDSPDLPLENPLQAVHSGSSIAISRDAGATFAAIEVPGIHQVKALVFGSKALGLRYALGDASAFSITRDGGLSWQTYRNAFPLALPAGAIVTDPRDEAFIYLQYPGQVGIPQWSPELGVFQMVPGLPPNATGPYLRPRSIQLFAAAGDSLYLSLSPGGVWESFAKIPGGESIADVAFDVAGTRRIYVYTTQGSLLRTNDDGGNWQAITLPGPRNIRIAKIAVNPYRAGHVIFLAPTASFLSTDGGATLQPISIPGDAQGLEFDPNSPATLFASNRRYISQDSGLSWKAHFPGRFGRRVCGALEPAICYALAERFDNFYIEKLDSEGTLQWATYWGDDDPSSPRSAFVDKQGVLWLNTGRKVARISPDGSLIDVRVTQENLADLTITGSGRLVALLEGRVAELNSDTLTILENSQSLVTAQPPLVPYEDRVAFRTASGAGIFRPGVAEPDLPPFEENFSPKALAWNRDGELLIAGNYFYSLNPRRSRVELRAWSGSEFRKIASLQGESSETVQQMAVDSGDRIWLFGFTSSKRIPLRSPLFNGPRAGTSVGFLSLIAKNGGEPLFSTHFSDASLPLASGNTLDILRISEPLVAIATTPVDGLPFIINLGYSSYLPLRLEPNGRPTLRIASVEKRFDRSGGDWSKGSWIRVMSQDLLDLSPFELPVWSADRPQEHEGAKLLLNGQPITLIGAGPGHLDAVIDNLDSDEHDAPAQLVLERNGAISQTLRLTVDRFDFELLPRRDNPDLALCYNADGTENSESNPALAGSQVALIAIGSQGSSAIYLNPERIGEFDDTDWPTYSSDYVEDVPGVLPGLRYIGLTLKGLGRFTGTRKVGLYRYYEDQPSLYVWVRGQ